MRLGSGYSQTASSATLQQQQQRQQQRADQIFTSDYHSHPYQQLQLVLVHQHCLQCRVHSDTVINERHVQRSIATQVLIVSVPTDRHRERERERERVNQSISQPVCVCVCVTDGRGALRIVHWFITVSHTESSLIVITITCILLSAQTVILISV